MKAPAMDQARCLCCVSHWFGVGCRMLSACQSCGEYRQEETIADDLGACWCVCGVVGGLGEFLGVGVDREFLGFLVGLVGFPRKGLMFSGLGDFGRLGVDRVGFIGRNHEEFLLFVKR